VPRPYVSPLLTHRTYYFSPLPASCMASFSPRYGLSRPPAPPRRSPFPILYHLSLVWWLAAGAASVRCSPPFRLKPTPFPHVRISTYPLYNTRLDKSQRLQGLGYTQAPPHHTDTNAETDMTTLPAYSDTTVGRCQTASHFLWRGAPWALSISSFSFWACSHPVKGDVFFGSFPSSSLLERVLPPPDRTGSPRFSERLVAHLSSPDVISFSALIFLLSGQHFLL